MSTAFKELNNLVRTAACAAVLLAAASAPAWGDDTHQSQELRALGTGGGVSPAEAEFVGAKLRTYCQACHGLGELRFIHSEDDTAVWNYLFRNQAPRTRKLWSQAIIEVLSWPGNTPPPPSPIMDPVNGRDWMPKGAKRNTLAADMLNGVPVRTMLLDLIRRGP